MNIKIELETKKTEIVTLLSNWAIMENFFESKGNSVKVSEGGIKISVEIDGCKIVKKMQQIQPIEVDESQPEAMVSFSGNINFETALDILKEFQRLEFIEEACFVDTRGRIDAKFLLKFYVPEQYFLPQEQNMTDEEAMEAAQE